MPSDNSILDDDDIDTDDDNNEGDASSLVKNLRRQLKAAKKELSEASQFIDEVKAERRKGSVAEALEARGADKKYAKFYTDSDATPEKVEAWIVENADLFGIDTDAGDDTSQAAEAISRATARAPQVGVGSDADLLHQIETLDRAGLEALYARLEA